MSRTVWVQRNLPPAFHALLVGRVSANIASQASASTFSTMDAKEI